MKRIKTLKYYSMGKFTYPLEAQKEADRLSEKHPDRDYTILINMRASYKRYIVAQVKPIEVQWPEESDLGFGPPPEAPDWSTRWSGNAVDQQRWLDYEYEAARHRDAVRKATKQPIAALDEKLNP